VCGDERVTVTYFLDYDLKTKAATTDFTGLKALEIQIFRMALCGKVRLFTDSAGVQRKEYTMTMNVESSLSSVSRQYVLKVSSMIRGTLNG
jgi:hypothetical protein